MGRHWAALTAAVLAGILVGIPGETNGPQFRPEQQQPPRISIAGESLLAGDACFVPFGYYYGRDRDGFWTGKYFRSPSPEGLRQITRAMREARNHYGANTIRIFLELPTFMRRPDRLSPRAMRALADVMDRADRLGLYLVLVGNVTTRPRTARAWYDDMGERGRWRIQARFWRLLARSLRGDTTVAWYELTNEPIVPVADDDRWYRGKFGLGYWAQNIVRRLKGRDRDQIARDWINKMHSAVEREDPEVLVSIGLLPFPDTDNAFRPEVAAGLLDLSVVHEYPRGEVSADSVAAMSAWDEATAGPVVLGEVLALFAPVSTTREFILGSRAHVAGYLSLYNGQRPQDLDETDITSALWHENLQMFTALKPSVCGGCCPMLSGGNG